MPNKPTCFDVVNRLAHQDEWPLQGFGYDGQRQLYTQVGCGLGVRA